MSYELLVPVSVKFITHNLIIEYLLQFRIQTWPS